MRDSGLGSLELSWSPSGWKDGGSSGVGTHSGWKSGSSSGVGAHSSWESEGSTGDGALSGGRILLTSLGNNGDMRVGAMLPTLLDQKSVS